MQNGYASHARELLDRIRADGFYKTERVIGSPQAAAIRLAEGDEVLNFCANNYLGLADDPRLVAAAKEGLDAVGFGMASVRFICGTQSVHKRARSARLRAFLRYRRHDPLFELLRRERRPVRNAARRGGRRHQRRAEPREHRRRHPPVQGAALPLSQQRHGGPRGAAEGSRRRRCALQADRDRWRVLDGRHRRGPARDLRPGGRARRAGDGRRFARRRLRRRSAGAARPSSAASKAASTSSPARSARRSAARRAAIRPGARRSSSCCASARARISSPTRLRPCIAAASLEVLELLASDGRRGAAPARASKRRSFPPRR